MAGYIGSKASVTQVDGYNRTEADSEFVNDPNDVITVSGSNVGIGASSPDSILDVRSGSNPQVVLNNTDGTSNDSHDFRIGTFGGSTPYWSSLSLDASSHKFKTYGAERMRIDAAGRVTMPYQPCFSGSASGANLTWSAGSTITKQVNITYIPVNVGGHFSDSTNRFTAPVAGNYYFSAKSTQTGTATGPSMHFFKNGFTHGYEASIGYYTAYHSFTGSTIMSLAAGDYVDLRITNYNSVALTIDGTRTTFSGYLIG